MDPVLPVQFWIGALLLSYLIVAYHRFGPPPCVLCGGREGKHGPRCPQRKKEDE